MDEVRPGEYKEEKDTGKVNQCPALLARRTNATHLETTVVAGNLARREFCLAARARNWKFAPVRLGHATCLFQQEDVDDILIYANLFYTISCAVRASNGYYYLVMVGSLLLSIGKIYQGVKTIYLLEKTGNAL